MNLSDGVGTEIQTLPINKTVKINNYERKIEYVSNVESMPELSAYITNDPSVYKNKFILVFNATDKETGIKSVKIREGRHDWKEIESPYLLVDQTRHSNVSLQATNYSGASVIVNIDKIPYNWKYITTVGFICLISVILLVLVIKKIYAYKKKL